MGWCALLHPTSGCVDAAVVEQHFTFSISAPHWKETAHPQACSLFTVGLGKRNWLFAVTAPKVPSDTTTKHSYKKHSPRKPRLCFGPQDNLVHLGSSLLFEKFAKYSKLPRYRNNGSAAGGTLPDLGLRDLAF